MKAIRIISCIVLRFTVRAPSARMRLVYIKNMLAGILLHILKLKTTYSHENHHYGGYNQLLKSRAST